MNTETMQTEKLEVTEYLSVTHTQEKRLLSPIEVILNEAKAGSILKGLTREDLENRALQSLENIRLGKVFSQQEIETNSQLW